MKKNGDEKSCKTSSVKFLGLGFSWTYPVLYMEPRFRGWNMFNFFHVLAVIHILWWIPAVGYKGGGGTQNYCVAYSDGWILLKMKALIYRMIFLHKNLRFSLQRQFWRHIACCQSCCSLQCIWKNLHGNLQPLLEIGYRLQWRFWIPHCSSH
jgi:hypothetical protein